MKKGHSNYSLCAAFVNEICSRTFGGEEGTGVPLFAKNIKCFNKT